MAPGEFDMVRFVLDPEEETYANPPWATFLLRSLLGNNDFQEAFLQRFSDLLNTTFTPEHAKSLINDMADVIRPEMPRHISRWSHPPTFRHWEQHVDVMLRFAEERPAHQIAHLQQHFGLLEPELISLVLPEQGHGLIHLNSLELGQPLQAPESAGLRTFEDGSKTWEGRYFPEIPLQLRAEPSAGYRFAHWVVNGDTLTESAIEWLPDGTTTIPSVFRP
jgi:hypothetical protein